MKSGNSFLLLFRPPDATGQVIYLIPPSLFSIFIFRILQTLHNRNICPDAVHGSGTYAARVSGAFAAYTGDDAAAAESEQVLAARRAHQGFEVRVSDRSATRHTLCRQPAESSGRIRQAAPQHGRAKSGRQAAASLPSSRRWDSQANRRVFGSACRSENPRPSGTARGASRSACTPRARSGAAAPHAAERRAVVVVLRVKADTASAALAFCRRAHDAHAVGDDRVLFALCNDHAAPGHMQKE